MANRKKRVSPYHTAVNGAKGILRVLVYAFILLLIVFAGKKAYGYGYSVFDSHPMAESEEEAVEVTIVISEDESVLDIGKSLEEAGLIESASVFWMQERISDYHDQISPGTYVLNTHQDVEEMLAVMASTEAEE